MAELRAEDTPMPMPSRAKMKARMATGITLAVILAGMGAVVQLPREFEPDVKRPIVRVRVAPSGRAIHSIQDLEEIVRRVEIEIAREERGTYRTMESVVGEHGGEVTLLFAEDADDATLREAVANARSAVERVELPGDFEAHVTRDVKERAIASVFLSAPAQDDNRLQTLGRELSDRLEALDGVKKVRPVNLLKKQILIETEPLRLAKHSLSFEDLIAALQASYGRVFLGTEKTAGLGEPPHQIRVSGAEEPLTAESVANTIVARFGESVVRVADVATVRLTHEEEKTEARSGGEPAVQMAWEYAQKVIAAGK
jgi:multidrug efflux pump subunit AcrB